jgi:hypothetical protein
MRRVVSRKAILYCACFSVACTTAGGLPAVHQAEGQRPVTIAKSKQGGRGECKPAPEFGRPQFLIGYGSLMQDESRARTAPRAGKAFPTLVRGFRRGWFARGAATGFGTTYLGVVGDAESRINAVIYAVDVEEVAATDVRESSYCRQIVDGAQVLPLASEPPSAEAQIWIYVSALEDIAVPDSRFPVVQSYVDIFVGGCLEQEQRFKVDGFARQCLTSTTDWSYYWVNDRIYPRRPYVHQPKAREIDKLLSEQLPEQFSRIRIESGR